MNFIRQVEDKVYKLCGEKHVWGEGPDDDGLRMAFIGEAPGEEEEIHQRPFVGKSGDLLNRAFSTALIYRPSVWITNVISVRPPDNDIKHPYAKEAIEAEKSEFWKEIKFLVKEKHVRVIVALGQTAMNSLGISGNITKNRGSVYELNSDEDCVVVPTYHPSYLLRKGRWYERGKGKADLYLTFLEDIKKAKEIALNGYTRPVEHFNINPTLEDVIEFRKKVLKENMLLAVDIETTGGLNRYKAEIAMIGFATDGENALVVPFYSQGKLPYWNQKDELQVKQELNLILQQARLMFQNSLFDVPFLITKGYNVNFDHIEHDTLILHHALNPELPHNLGFIVSVYGDTPYWKEIKTSKNLPNMGLSDEDFRTYNARDCIVLHQVLPKLLAEFAEKDPSHQRIYYDESMKLIKPVAKMMLNGIGYSIQQQRKWNKEMKATIQRLEMELRSKWNLPPEFSLTSDDDLRLLFYGVVPNRYMKHIELESKTRTDTQIYATLKAYRKILNEVKPFLMPIGFAPPVSPKDKKFQLDKEARLKYILAMLEREELVKKFKHPTKEHLKELEAYPKQRDFLNTFNEYVTAKKLLSTYSEFPSVHEGRLHPEFSICGTSTGRFSSKTPNAQNFPKKEKNFRKVFVASEGNLLVSADYINLEVGTMAYESGEPNFIEAFEKGINIHDMNTKLLFGIDKDHPNWSISRRVAKIIQFGIQYGGAPRKIYQQALVELMNASLSRNKFESIVTRYFQVNSTFKQWYDRTRENAAKTRKVTTFMGRVRYLYGNKYDIEKEALNTPCQGAAAHIINRAMIRVDNRLEKELPNVKLVLQIHDELIFDCPTEDVPKLVQRLQEEMPKEVNFHGKTARFPIDIEVGPSFGELKPLHGN
jgi:uracil-DNA glycosylase family 4